MGALTEPVVPEVRDRMGLRAPGCGPGCHQDLCCQDLPVVDLTHDLPAHGPVPSKPLGDRRAVVRRREEFLDTPVGIERALRIIATSSCDLTSRSPSTSGATATVRSRNTSAMSRRIEGSIPTRLAPPIIPRSPSIHLRPFGAGYSQ